jgi:enoyl-CoA hydratase
MTSRSITTTEERSMSTDDAASKGSESSPVLTEVHGAVGIITLNRPVRRNAINADLLDRLVTAVKTCDDDPDVRVMVLTGTDPAFCAGLDLAALAGGERIGQAEPGQHGPFPAMSTPVIGAINGPAVTGGLELALACDMLIASTQATFADTHARVGIMPGWGMSVLLPAAIGQRRATQMSLSGNYVDAETACAWGLVNAVVPHDELLDTAVALADDIADAHPLAVRELLGLYRRTTATTTDRAWDIEAETSRSWWRNYMDRSAVGDRASAIIDRGRRQTRPTD